MNDTIRELINCVLDYVEETPGTYFRVKRWARGMKDAAENQMFFEFWRDDEPHYVPRDGDEYWSQISELDEDNLRYLVEQLEGEK